MAENESVIERVAKALCDLTRGQGGWDAMIAQLVNAGTKRPGPAEARYYGEARAAIAALRQPTEEMLAAADSAIPRFESDETGHRLMGRDGALEVWRAMIDAALPLPPSTARTT